jgi:tyrosine-protein kinase Etk/Wzc
MSILLPDTQTDPDEISLLDLLQVVAENLRLLVLVPLVTGLLALGISFALPPTFTASTKFLPPQQQQSAALAMLQTLGALGGLAGGGAGIKNPADQFIGFLKSQTILDALVNRFKLKERYDKEYTEDARKVLLTNSSISSGKDGLISIHVEDRDPRFAAQLANGYVEELNGLLNRLSLTESQQRRVFFEAQLQSTKQKLTSAEQALRATGVNSSALKSNPESAVLAVTRVQAEIAGQEVKLSSMRSYLSESAPALKLAQTELAALRQQLNKLEKTSDSAGPSDSDYVARFRDFKYHETLFEFFAKQFEMAKVDESREGNTIQVVDIAQPPEKKSKPQKAIIAALTSVVTGLLLLIFVFVRQSLRNAVARQPSAARKISVIRTAIWFKKMD